jgi:hypothetical protein
MKIRRLAFAMLFCVASLLGVSVLTPAGAHAARPAPTGAATTQVAGTTAAGTVSGLFTVTKFVTQNGQLLAVGTISNLTQTVAGVTTAVPGTQQVSLPVNTQQSTGSCTILDLVLGPLHLDLLGLVVDLNQVHLTITAQQGPGNLLGNLLCAVANLLNGGLSLNTLANLLNQLLALLR